MKLFVAIFTLAIFTMTGARAQTFLEDIQKQDVGKGTVTVKQSQDIDDLVNGKTPINVTTTDVNTTGKTTVQPKADAQTKSDSQTANAGQAAVKAPNSAETAKPNESSNADKERRIVKKTPVETNTDSEGSDTKIVRKKVVKGGQKVNGFRVLVYAGGNTRADKQKAQVAGQRVKAKYPSLPIFVHFNTPRWTCMAGSFSDRNEAQKVLNGVKALGYTGACIVSAKIVVQK